MADPASSWSRALRVQVGGAGTIAHAGVVLPRLVADRVGLTSGLATAVAKTGFHPVRDRGRVLVDTACAMIAGATCVTDVEAMTSQVELFGPSGGASDSTLLRALDELGERIAGTDLPTRRLADAVAAARARAWDAIVERHGSLPSVQVAGRALSRVTTVADGTTRVTPVTVIRLDGTLIDAASNKSGAAGTWKGGFGLHPLTAWCSNVGDNLAVMLRPGNAGTFTAADHIAVLTAAMAQIPAPYRRDVLVTVDGAGASHALIEHVTALNTHRTQGGRGRRVEFSIGWPVDERTRTALALAPKSAWGPGLHADGRLDEDAQILDITGLLRASMHGQMLPTWPQDLRVIARRTPRAVGEQPELGQDPHFRYGAFATNTQAGQIQWLDARHRTQAHVEDGIKELKALGGRRLPSSGWGRNSAWLFLAGLAASLTAWLRHLALEGENAKAEIKTLRYRIFCAPGRLATHARVRVLKIPPGWAWSVTITDAWERLQALHPA